MLIRDLGHFPVAGELKLKAHQDKNFPNPNTFSERLGSKRQIASKIVEYCNKHKNYEDVLTLSKPA